MSEEFKKYRKKYQGKYFIDSEDGEYLRIKKVLEGYSCYSVFVDVIFSGTIISNRKYFVTLNWFKRLKKISKAKFFNCVCHV